MTIPVKVISVDLKAGESVIAMQPVYYDSVNKDFTTEPSHTDSTEIKHDLYGFAAESVAVDSSKVDTTNITVYASGEFFKDAVVIVNEESISDLIIESRKLGIYLE